MTKIKSLYWKKKPLLGLALCALFLLRCGTSPASPSSATTQKKPAQTVPRSSSTQPSGQRPDQPSGEIRPPAFAGAWYPDDPEELTTMLDVFLEAVKPVDGEPVALIVPHAGYVFSGPIAAYGFKQMQGGDYDLAVILAADHQPPLSRPISVWAEGGFETPLGTMPVDSQLAQALIAADPQISYDPASHESEHSIEIELPFIQSLCPNCKILPVLMGSDDEECVEILANALLSVLPEERVVVIASSDLSHYPTYDKANKVDSAVLGAIETGDPARVREAIDQKMDEGVKNLFTCACGEGPILVAMRVAQELGASNITVLKHATSGDSPLGDKSQVVGYGAVMFWHYQPPELSGEQRQILLEAAREAISEHLTSGRTAEEEVNDPALTRRAGVFVTLSQDGELRGCIGRLRADLPLYQAVGKMAISAATSDPRFPPLTTEELEAIQIEISVLSPLQRITQVEEIQVGIHGLLLLQGSQQGVLLPQVPVEQGWDREEFLENLCLKASLPGDCWTNEPTLYTFTAVIFGE